MRIIRYSKEPVLENLFHYLARHDSAFLLHNFWKSLFQFYKIFCWCHVTLPKEASNHTVFIHHSAKGTAAMNPGQALLSEDFTIKLFMLNFNLPTGTNSKDTIICEDQYIFKSAWKEKGTIYLGCCFIEKHSSTDKYWKLKTATKLQSAYGHNEFKRLT